MYLTRDSVREDDKEFQISIAHQLRPSRASNRELQTPETDTQLQEHKLQRPKAQTPKTKSTNSKDQRPTPKPQKSKLQKPETPKTKDQTPKPQNPKLQKPKTENQKPRPKAQPSKSRNSLLQTISDSDVSFCRSPAPANLSPSSNTPLVCHVQNNPSHPGSVDGDSNTCRGAELKHT